MVVGRGADADIRVDNPLVSRAHAVVCFHNGKWQVEDLESPNGLYLNGERTQVGELAVGDRIELGRHVLIFEGTGESEFDVDTLRAAPRLEGTDTEATAILQPLDVENIQRRVRERMNMHVVMVWGQERKELPLDLDNYLVGYTDSCNLRLPGGSLFGKEVARITREKDTYRLDALSTLTKVRVNGQRIKMRRLEDGDRIRIRNVTLQFHLPVGGKKKLKDS